MQVQKGVRSATVVFAATVIVVAASFGAISLASSAGSASGSQLTPSPNGISSQEAANTSSSSTASTGPPLSGAALVAECPSAGEAGFGTVNVTTATPAIFCVRLFYYNGNATETLNVTQLLSVGVRSIDGSANFTITPSQPLITLGGPTNESEGVVLAYAITAKPGVSGTYWIGFLTGTLDDFMLGSQPETCGAYGVLVAGSGQPDYSASMTPLCVGYPFQAAAGPCTLTEAGCKAATLPGLPYPLLVGYTYFDLIGAASSPG